MSWHERLFNVALGLSALSWALLGVILHPLSVPRLVITALNVTVGALLLRRRPLTKSGSLPAIVMSLPGVVVAGLALKAAPPLEAWPLVAQALFAAGGALTIGAFLQLGQSFAILPARRRIVVRGPYALIRHPAYLCELVMVAAYVVAGPSLTTGLLLGCALPLVVLRIVMEERLLREDEVYRAYAERVRTRLLPFIW